jgi:hypothetical protein
LIYKNNVLPQFTGGNTCLHRRIACPNRSWRTGLFLSASTPTDPGAYASFAAGVALYAVALLLASIPPAFPLWTRIAGALAALPFAAHALLSLLGRSPAPSGPLASIGYVLLTLTIVGWMIAVLRAAPSSQR